MTRKTLQTLLLAAAIGFMPIAASAGLVEAQAYLRTLPAGMQNYAACSIVNYSGKADGLPQMDCAGKYGAEAKAACKALGVAGCNAAIDTLTLAAAEAMIK